MRDVRVRSQHVKTVKIRKNNSETRNVSKFTVSSRVVVRFCSQSPKTEILSRLIYFCLSQRFFEKIKNTFIVKQYTAHRYNDDPMGNFNSLVSNLVL